LQEDNVSEESVVNILEVRINPNTNDDSIEKWSPSVNNNIPKNNKNEPVYVNSVVDNTYLKVSINKVYISEDGIRLSIKVLWNIIKDDRQTKDWIGCYKLGSYIKLFYYYNIE